jgi:hypothetical protein
MDFAFGFLEDTRSLCRGPLEGDDGVDDRTRLFLCVLASAGFLAVLAGLFGALTGVITWKDERAAGTGLGFSVARAFARLSENGLSPSTYGALVGGADGVLFGALAGTLIGLVAGWYGRGEWETLRPILLGATLLAGGAVLFGLMAFGLAIAGTRCLLGLFVGALAGAFDGFQAGGIAGLLPGLLAGGIAGTLLFLMLFRQRSRGA